MDAVVTQKTFDLDLARLVGDAGRKIAALKRSELLEEARRIAREIAGGREDRTVSADDVQARLLELGMPPGALGNAAGSIFDKREWAFSGKWVPSQRVSNRGRYIRVWMLVG